MSQPRRGPVAFADRQVHSLAATDGKAAAMGCGRGSSVSAGQATLGLQYPPRQSREKAGLIPMPEKVSICAACKTFGWNDPTRARNLQRVVNNSRFLLLPWVAVRNLAGAVLARGLG